MKPVRTAVLPVAGLGTRLLPATKALPKEMLTIVDRPIIDHVVREARSAGIERFVFVTGRGKGMIEDHFDRQYELEAMLALRGKHELLELLERQGLNPGEAVFTRQQEPRGLGHGGRVYRTRGSFQKLATTGAGWYFRPNANIPNRTGFVGSPASASSK